MIPFFRKIRKNMADNNKPMKYARYAIGEIALVVIGILIALQINNWNEDNKAEKNEAYILNEILKNLDEDASLVDEIILQRTKASTSVIYLKKYSSNKEINLDSLEYHMINLFTFERYYPINNAYEILKSKGLHLSNNDLTTEISRYYDYEQNKVMSSVMDIEEVIVKIFQSPIGLMRFFSHLKKDTAISIIDMHDPNFKKELSSLLLAFEDNSNGTLDKLLFFKTANFKLQENIISELHE